MKKETRLKKPFHLSVVISVIAAVAILLISFFLLSVHKVVGDSMSPVVKEKDIVITFNVGEIEKGDVIAFYYGNRILVRRVIGMQGDWIDINGEGTVSVNGTDIEEPYVRKKVSGVGDTEFPYQVPAGRYFVLGDNREKTPDSRTSVIGCISEEQLIGKVLFRIWPLTRIGYVRGADY